MLEEIAAGIALRRGSAEQTRLAPGRTRGLHRQSLLYRGLQDGGRALSSSLTTGPDGTGAEMEDGKMADP